MFSNKHKLTEHPRMNEKVVMNYTHNQKHIHTPH